MQAETARFVAISRASSPDSPACWPDSARASSPPTTEFVTHVPVAKGRKPQAEQRMVEFDIHHSFLPAFLGGSPYIQTYRRGVKPDRATAHLATEDLDEGPIIEQDVMRVGQSMSAPDLERAGADNERIILVQTVHGHRDGRPFDHENRTVILG
jgi:hypothetical protein